MPSAEPTRESEDAVTGVARGLPTLGNERRRADDAVSYEKA